MSSPTSYGQILRSSSIVGGAHGVNYLIGLVRMKAVALLLGPAGIGLVGLYVSATTLVGAITQFGIGTSGVREVAEAHSKGDERAVALTVITLRRVCWITGILGWITTVLLAYPLSLWTFSSGSYTVPIALLGSTLLLTSISAGQTAVLQGTRRIGDIARLDVGSVIASTVISIAAYATLGGRGIVPVLIGTAAINLAFSWWYSRRVPVQKVGMTWRESVGRSRRLLTLGAAFMLSAVLSSLGALALRAMIVRQLGLDANGIYQAAWGISGMFAGFILGAMATDFYPRLTAASDDHQRLNRLINEQTEVGMLLALPGLLATLGFAVPLMKIFYSPRFSAGGELLPWFVLGIFGQVISWPMGFALAAKGASAWFASVEAFAHVLRLALSLALLHWIGLPGTAVAVPILYAVHTGVLYMICRNLTGFEWTRGSLQLMTTSLLIILGAFAISTFLSGHTAMIFEGLLLLVAALFSVRGVVHRIGTEHRLVKFVFRVPGIERVCRI